MERIFNYLIYLLIFLIGSVLLIVGIKKLKIKKRGILATGLIIFLSLTGCKNNNKIQNTANEMKKEFDINKIIKTDEWQEFKKTALKILDRENDFFPDKKATDKLKEELKFNIDKVYQKTGKDSIEIEILNDLCLNKLIITENYTRKMVMHTIPPDTIIELTFSKINNSLSSLNQLKKENLIDQKQYEGALEILMSEITDFAKINFVYKYYFTSPAVFYNEFSISKETDELVKYSIGQLETDYLKQKEELKIKPDKLKLDELEKKYNNTKDKINKTDLVKKNIKILIKDLVK